MFCGASFTSILTGAALSAWQETKSHIIATTEDLESFFDENINKVLEKNKDSIKDEVEGEMLKNDENNIAIDPCFKWSFS